MKFTDFELDEKILKGIENAGFTECLPVQEMSLKETLKGRDVSVRSQTGSGKTAAFMIPILQYYCTAPEKGKVKTLIVAPTRELAVQIANDAKILSSAMDIRIASFYGGVGYKQQESSLGKGTDIIIGTPGRLLDFGKSGKINYHDFGKVVIDEADRLFDMGFYPDIKKMMHMLPPREKRQTMLFSATLNSRVRNLAWDFMNLPVEIEVEPENVTVEEISQVLYHVSTDEKIPLLIGLLEKLKPNNAIIFTNTKYAAVEITERLKLNGHHVIYIMGDLPQKKRLSVIKKIKSGEVKFLVATDVAARGLHIDDLEMVINYDLPEDFENYVHRIGRTARAGKSGKAISFACEKYVYGLEAIEKYIGFKIPVEWADTGLFAKDKSAGMRLDLGRFNQRSARSFRKPLHRSAGGNRSGTEVRRTSGRRDKQPAFRKKSTGGESIPADHGKRGSSSVKHEKKNANRTGVSAKPIVKLSPGSSAEERLAYYRAKYGEDFKFTSMDERGRSTPSVKQEEKKKKKGILRKIFSRKKK